MSFKYFLPLIALLFSFSLLAQTGEVRGFVYDEENGDPILFANVYLHGTTIGNNTDATGYYSIAKLAEGNYTLIISVIGYDSFGVKLKITNGKVLTQNAYLKRKIFDLGEIEVSEKRTERKTDVKISVVTITPNQIKSLPSVGGAPDVAQYLQVVPGVVFTGDQGGQLYIRGGSPIQNKVILDGMTIYNPFHSIGLFSVFDVDIIRSMDVYTGGYPAEYGGRISAIMDIKTRDGNKKHMGGIVQMSPFTSKLLLEGPIKKLKDDGSASSLLVTGRSSYLDKTAPVFYSYADSSNLPYSFNDLYAKLNISGTKGSKVDFFGFSFNDKVNFASTKFHWNALGMGTHLLFLPPTSSTVIEANFAWSDYQMMQKEETDESPRQSKISGFEGGLKFSYYTGQDLIKYGAQFIGFSTDFSYRNAANRTVGQQEFTTELAGYVHYKFKRDKIILEPGLRLHYFASLAEMSPEPRFMGKILISKQFRLKFSSGLYAQNLISAVSDRDVVNLFYGFLSGPENTPQVYRGTTLVSRLQKAKHAIFGFEYDVTKFSMINVEGYVKRFNQLTNINRNKIFDDTREYASKDPYLRNDFIIEKGYAYGIDFNYEYEKKHLYIWAVYSLSYVTRTDEKITYHPIWDRRHNANLLCSYNFGEKQKYALSARWNFGSGFPFTQTQGYYELIDFQGGINTDYNKSNGDLGIIYSGYNQGRLPYYHRLDLSAKWHKEYSKYMKLEVSLSVTNAYNRPNIFYFNRVTQARVNQLPILPSLGLTFSF